MNNFKKKNIQNESLSRWHNLYKWLKIILAYCQKGNLISWCTRLKGKNIIQVYFCTFVPNLLSDNICHIYDKKFNVEHRIILEKPQSSISNCRN